MWLLMTVSITPRHAPNTMYPTDSHGSPLKIVATNERKRVVYRSVLRSSDFIFLK